jgi:hypothetical protein
MSPASLLILPTSLRRAGHEGDTACRARRSRALPPCRFSGTQDSPPKVSHDSQASSVPTRKLNRRTVLYVAQGSLPRRAFVPPADEATTCRHNKGNFAAEEVDRANPYKSLVVHAFPLPRSPVDNRMESVDHCREERSYHPQTRQRLVDTTKVTLPRTNRVLSVQVTRSPCVSASTLTGR